MEIHSHHFLILLLLITGCGLKKTDSSVPEETKAIEEDEDKSSKNPSKLGGEEENSENSLGELFSNVSGIIIGKNNDVELFIENNNNTPIVLYCNEELKGEMTEYKNGYYSMTISLKPEKRCRMCFMPCQKTKKVMRLL